MKENCSTFQNIDQCQRVKKFAGSEIIKGKKTLDWNTSSVKAHFYPFSLTNSGNELINELRCNFEVSRTSLIHRLMNIPTNSSSNNRRTIKSSPFNRTPPSSLHPRSLSLSFSFSLHHRIHCAIKASNTEQTKQSNLISCYEFTGKKFPRNHPKKCFMLRLMASENCFRLRGVSDNDSHRMFQLQKITGSFV